MLRESATERYQLVVDGEYYSYITQECPLIASVEQSACTTRAYDEPENILDRDRQRLACGRFHFIVGRVAS